MERKASKGNGISGKRLSQEELSKLSQTLRENIEKTRSKAADGQRHECDRKIFEEIIRLAQNSNFGETRSVTRAFVHYPPFTKHDIKEVVDLVDHYVGECGFHSLGYCWVEGEEHWWMGVCGYVTISMYFHPAAYTESLVI